MAPILANTEVQQRLTPYLPSGESLPQSSEELHHTISSPQFQQVQHIGHIMVQCPERMNLCFYVHVCIQPHWLNQANKHRARFPNTLHKPSILPVLSAGYEHVQQCPGVGAAGASHEPVWPACRGCWCCQQRRSVFCPHTRSYLVTACGLLGIYWTVQKQWRGDKLLKCVNLYF